MSARSTRPEGSWGEEAGWCWPCCSAPGLPARCHCSSPGIRLGDGTWHGAGSGTHQQTRNVLWETPLLCLRNGQEWKKKRTTKNKIKRKILETNIYSRGMLVSTSDEAHLLKYSSCSLLEYLHFLLLYIHSTTSCRQILYFYSTMYLKTVIIIHYST